MATTEIARTFAQFAIEVTYALAGGWEIVGTMVKRATIVRSIQIFTYTVVVDKNWLAGFSPPDRDHRAGGDSRRRDEAKA